MEVISVYEIYLDIFFVDNIMTNIFVLMTTVLIAGIKMNLKRIVGASCIGAMVSVSILYFRIGYGVAYVLIVVGSELAMLCFVGMNRRKSLNGIIYMNAISFAYSKLNDCINRLARRHVSPVIAISMVIITSVLLVTYRKISKKRTVYKVVLCQNGMSLEARALYDSGNLLTEPVSQKAVSIIDKTPILNDWMINTPEKFKIIPYKSVGEENGILEGMVIDQLIILHDDKKVVEDEAVIALYDGKLSADGSFNMILNHNLI